MPTVGEIFDFLNTKAPVETKLDFDNVGLLVGSRDWPVESVLLSLDITAEVVAEAGPVPVAVRGTAAPRADVAAAAAQHTVIARCSTQSANIFRLHDRASACSVNAVSAVRCAWYSVSPHSPRSNASAYAFNLRR